MTTALAHGLTSPILNSLARENIEKTLPLTNLGLKFTTVQAVSFERPGEVYEDRHCGGSRRGGFHSSSRPSSR